MKRLFALFVCCMMICMACPLSLVSADSVCAETGVCSNEVRELRSKNSETYLLPNGEYECVIYAHDKYFETPNGDLAEIDNSIVAADMQFGSNSYSYTNRAGNNHVYFSSDSLSVLVSSEKGNLMFKGNSANACRAIVGGTTADIAIPDIALEGPDCLAYKNVQDNTDIVYRVVDGSLKEFIILNDSSAPTDISFIYTLNGLTVSQCENGSIVFNDSEGTPVYELGALFAVDASGTYTEDLEYSLESMGDNAALVTVSLSKEYAADPSRAFPVVIDPSVVIKGSSNTYDSYVSSKNPGSHYYLSNYLRMGWDTNYYVRRSYVKFDLDSAVNGNVITLAYMSLKKYDGGNDPSLKAYRVTGSWTSSSITWDNMPGFSTTYASDTAVPKTNNWYRFDITEIVKRWYSGTYSNYGVVVINSTESGIGNWSTFYSSDSGTDTCPQLRVRYVNYLGSRPYQTAPEGEDANCMGYALETVQFVSDNALGLDTSSINYKSLPALLNVIKTASENWLNDNYGSSNWNEISGYESSISSGWFRVVLRVGFLDRNNNGRYDANYNEVFDYHWWYQTNINNGEWANKQGTGASTLISNTNGVDPEACMWYNSHGFYYDSDAVFYAIRDIKTWPEVWLP